MTGRGAIARAEVYFEHARAEKRSAIPIFVTLLYFCNNYAIVKYIWQN